MEYFCKYLSICYLGSANFSHGDKNSGEDSFPYIDSTAPGTPSQVGERFAKSACPTLRLISRGPQSYSRTRQRRVTSSHPRIRALGAYDAYFRVSGVDQLAAEFRDRGAVIREGPTNRVYDVREVVIEDLNGLVLAFGEPISSVAAGRE